MNMNQVNIDKTALTSLVMNELSKELNQAINAANEAHAAAVDDQSVAETQYDTLAIEASYLAEGQSRRVQELQTALKAYQDSNFVVFDEDKPIKLTALVQLAKDSTKQHWFFIGPAAGGFRCEVLGQHITVITPQSPMGLALLDKYQGDDVDITLGTNQLCDYIAMVQ
jgi:transcription elongation GreA/GreB family factor